MSQLWFFTTGVTGIGFLYKINPEWFTQNFSGPGMYVVFPLYAFGSLFWIMCKLAEARYTKNCS